MTSEEDWPTQAEEIEIEEWIKENHPGNDCICIECFFKEF